MKVFAALALLAAALLTLPASGQAQPAYTSVNVHLRAGPAIDYPVVDILPAGLEITVYGCLSNYTWCDVVAGRNRGWVYAAHIHYFHQGAYVPVLVYGPRISITIVGFVLFDYWTLHYRDRPFYRERERWGGPPRPPHSAGPGLPPPPPPRQGSPRIQRQQPPQHSAPGGQPQQRQQGGPGGRQPSQKRQQDGQGGGPGGPRH